MKNAKRTMGVLILFAANVLAVPTARSQSVATPAGTQGAGCLLRIVTESSVISLSDNAIDYLFQSYKVRGAAITEVLGSGIRPREAFIQAKILEVTEIEGPPGERVILLSLEVGLVETVKPAAQELMDALVANFRKAVESVYRSELERLDRQAAIAKNEVEHAEREVAEIQHRLMEMSDSESSPGALRGRITEIRSQLQSLRLEKSAQEAYRRAIVKRVDEVTKEIEETVGNDEISSQLEQIVRRRMVELKEAQKKVDAGLVPSGDLASVEDRLAVARVDLARRREELAKTGGAANLAGLTAELATLTMESEKMQARETQLNLELEQTRERLARSGEFERTMLRLEVAKRDLQEAQTAHSKAAQRLRTFPTPSITVVGG